MTQTYRFRYLILILIPRTSRYKSWPPPSFSILFLRRSPNPKKNKAKIQKSKILIASPLSLGSALVIFSTSSLWIWTVHDVPHSWSGCRVTFDVVCSKVFFTTHTPDDSPALSISLSILWENEVLFFKQKTKSNQTKNLRCPTFETVFFPLIDFAKGRILEKHTPSPPKKNRWIYHFLIFSLENLPPDSALPQARWFPSPNPFKASTMLVLATRDATGVFCLEPLENEHPSSIVPTTRPRKSVECKEWDV